MSAPLPSDSIASPNRLPLLLLLGTMALSTSLNAYLLVAEPAAAGPPLHPTTTAAHAELARTRQLLAACRGESAAPETASTRVSTNASSEASSATIATFSDQ